MYNREYTPEKISVLKPNEIVVFGSNLAGTHAGGEAWMFYDPFGEIHGIGLLGQSYAIPTMQGGVETIKPYVDEFIAFAEAHPEYKFYVTKIGCGNVGFLVDEIAPLFAGTIDVHNVILPKEFVEVIQHKSDEIYRRLIEAMSQGHLNMGAYCDDVDVKLWMSEFNGINTTLFCDRLLKKHGQKGYFLLRTNTQDLNCVSLLTLEQQSSGFKLCEVLKGENWNDQGTVILKVGSAYVKDELTIMNKDNKWEAFGCHSQNPASILGHTHQVPTSQFGHSYILNFSVGGEFDLEIYYMPDPDAQAIWVLGKEYCCK